MQALSPEEFRAVLAHEFGHLSGNHGRFGGWIFRVKRTWIQAIDELERRQNSGDRRVRVAASISHSMLGPFFRWYASKLDGCAFVLSRAQEGQADLCAADLTSREAMAAALANMEVRGSFLSEEVWGRLYKEAESPELDPGVVRRIAASLAEGMEEATAVTYLVSALQEETGLQDSHPCLRERLQGLGFKLEPSDPESLATWMKRLGVGSQMRDSAADCFFGPPENGLHTELAKQWKSQVAPSWKEQFEERRKISQRLEALRAKRESAAISENESLELASLAESLDPPLALEIVQHLASSESTRGQAHLIWGRILLDRGDPAGIDHIEKAISADIHLVFPGCNAASAYLRHSGRESEAAAYDQRYNQAQVTFQLAQKERQGITLGDRLLSHELNDAAVDRLAALFSEYPHLEKAYVARKEVAYLPQIPYYIIGLLPKRNWLKPTLNSDDRALLELAKWVELEGYIIVLKGKHQSFHSIFEHVPSSLVFDRSRIGSKSAAAGA